MLANALTKCESDGTLPLEDLHKVLVEGYWEPKLAYFYEGQEVVPHS
jgi:hypothetical protein